MLFRQAAVKPSTTARYQLPKSCKQAKEHNLPDVHAEKTLQVAITCASSKLRHPIWEKLEGCLLLNGSASRQLLMPNGAISDRHCSTRRLQSSNGSTSEYEQLHAGTADQHEATSSLRCNPLLGSSLASHRPHASPGCSKLSAVILQTVICQAAAAMKHLTASRLVDHACAASYEAASHAAASEPIGSCMRC